MKDKEQDVFAQAAAQMHSAFPPIVQPITQDNADLERIYPKDGDVKSSIARQPTHNVIDFLPEAQKALFDALERVLLDPTISALPPMEQARIAAQLVIAESVASGSGVPVHDAKRYIAGLTYVDEENLEADGRESETNAPYYYGHSIVTAFEAGAVWQDQQTIESK